MQFTFSTRAGSTRKPSEDFVAVGPGAAILLDGLTAPSDLGTGCMHGTPWFVAHLGSQLLGRVTTRPTDPLTTLVAEAIDAVAGMHAGTCDLEHPGTPSSSIAMIRIGQENVDHLVLFDSVILVSALSAAQVAVATDHRVDSFAQREHDDAVAQHLGTEEHTRAISRLVARQRFHRNVTDGYWVAAAKPEAASHAMTNSVDRAGIRQVALLSDGASCLVEKYAKTDWPGLLKILEAEGPAALIGRVREAEESDPHGIRWPRYKCSDDATAIWCRLS
jgi:hypothetical protein